MSQSKSNIITKEDIIKHLKSGDDFAFEVETYQRVRAKGFRGSFSGTYIDSVTLKPRQYDIRAEGVMNDTKPVLLAIECKRLSSEFPLIVSCVLREPEESYHQILRSGPYRVNEGNSTRTDSNPNVVYRVKGNSEIYKEGVLVGKSTTQIGHGKNETYKESDSEFYDKWSQALSSAHDLVQKAAEYRSNNVTSRTYFSVVIPIVVVPDDTLWCVVYEKDGSMRDPKLATEIQFYIGKVYEFSSKNKYVMRYTVSHLHVFTPKGLEKFLGQITSNPNFTTLLVPDEVNLQRLDK